jgi:hypothetical protein
VVLQTFQRGSAIWLLAAMLIHGAANFVAVGLLRLFGVLATQPKVSAPSRPLPSLAGC